MAFQQYYTETGEVMKQYWCVDNKEHAWVKDMNCHSPAYYECYCKACGLVFKVPRTK